MTMTALLFLLQPIVDGASDPVQSLLSTFPNRKNIARFLCCEPNNQKSARPCEVVLQESGDLARPTTRNRTDVPESKACGHDEGKSAMEALADIIWELHEVCSGGNEPRRHFSSADVLSNSGKNKGFVSLKLCPIWCRARSHATPNDLSLLTLSQIHQTRQAFNFQARCAPGSVVWSTTLGTDTSSRNG